MCYMYHESFTSNFITQWMGIKQDLDTWILSISLRILSQCVGLIVRSSQLVGLLTFLFKLLRNSLKFTASTFI
jgi:hypothetical protein